MQFFFKFHSVSMAKSRNAVRFATDFNFTKALLLLAAFTLAPARTSSSTTASWPSSDANINAVHPS